MQQLLQENPDVEEINLDMRDIESVDELIPLIAQFNHVSKLSLAENRIQTLPPDLSCLTSIEELNLNGNVFENLESIILSITTIPLLKSIHLNLHEEEQVDFIFRTMPNLQFLNDTEVEREEISDQYTGEIDEEEEEEYDRDYEKGEDMDDEGERNQEYSNLEGEDLQSPDNEGMLDDQDDSQAVS